MIIFICIFLIFTIVYSDIMWLYIFTIYIFLSFYRCPSLRTRGIVYTKIITVCCGFWFYGPCFRFERQRNKTSNFKWIGWLYHCWERSINRTCLSRNYTNGENLLNQLYLYDLSWYRSHFLRWKVVCRKICSLCKYWKKQSIILHGANQMIACVPYIVCIFLSCSLWQVICYIPLLLFIFNVKTIWCSCVFIRNFIILYHNDNFFINLW